MIEFFNNVKEAKFGFKQIIDFISGIFKSATENADIASLWDKISGFISDYLIYVAIGLIVLGLIEAFFGKKLLTLQKFLGCFAVGFCAGVVYISPLVDKLFTIPSWIVGLVIGIVAAIICKLVYILAVALFAGYSVYYICYSASVLPQVTKFTEGNWIFSLIAAAVAILLVFLLLKYIEMAGTAFLGSWLAVAALNTVTDFMSLSFIQNFNVIVFWVLVGIVSLLGLVVQFRTRRRY